MRAGFLILIATVGTMMHVYTEGKYIHMLYENQKFVKLFAIAAAGMCAYYVFTNLTTSRKYELYRLTNNYLSNGAVDSSGKMPWQFPVLDMTNEHRYAGDDDADYPQTPFPLLGVGPGSGGGKISKVEPVAYSQRSVTRMLNSGMNNNGKRCVSAAKKKYVASSQNWRCAQCKSVFSSYFEVDHVQRIVDGGSNHVSNLRALCLDCHRRKTKSEMTKYGGGGGGGSGAI